MSASPVCSSHRENDLKKTSAVVDEEKASGTSTTQHEIDHSLPKINTAEENRLVRKIDLHLLPILWILYMMAFLDRVNIGNAKIEGLTTELKMTGNQFNVASMILFVPYIILEVPSNILMKRIPPSAWLSGLMFFWGLTTICQGLVTSYHGLLVARVFLGVFEAGVFPGAAYLIGMYYKRFELQKRLVFFFSSSLVAGAVGGLLAFALAKMKGVQGKSGWRWIFIIEGVITVGIAIISYFLIVDWPEDAKFLTSEEKELVAYRLSHDMNAGVARMDTLNRPAVKRIFRDWKIWCATCIYICVTTTGYATNFFIPTILTDFGWTSASAQVHTIPVYAVGAVLTLFCAWWSDRIQHRYAFTIGGITLAVIGYIILLCQGHKGVVNPIPIGVRYASIFFITSGNYIAQPLAIVWLANNMGGHYKRSFAAALQIGIGNVGGIIGSNIFLAAEQPYYKTGYGTGMGMLIAGALFCSIFYFGMMKENKIRDAGGRDYRLSLPEDEVKNMGDDYPSFRFNG